jgi:predicted dehydrogenase
MNEIGIGTIGCGGFALFSLEQYAAIDGVCLVALSEPNPAAAENAMRRFNLPEPESIESLCARSDVDLVYIATPPFLHHDHALSALRSGKHVVCEKPLAISLAEADEMRSAAKENDRLPVANLLQRYNLLSDAMKQSIDTGVVGKWLHGSTRITTCDRARRSVSVWLDPHDDANER